MCHLLSELNFCFDKLLEKNKAAANLCLFLRIITIAIIMYYYKIIITYYYIIITLLLHRYYTIIISLLQKGNHVIMITLLRVMQRASLCYYTIITYYYVIITPGSIITDYYLFQSPKLADGMIDDTYTSLSAVLCSF